MSMKKIFTLITALTLSVGLWAQTAGTTIIVHNLTGWDPLYLYMWGEGGNDLVGAWPGITAQRVDGENLYFYVDAGAYDGKHEYMIFNDSKGIQLSDHDFILGGTYELLVTLDGVFDATAPKVGDQFVDATSGLKFYVSAVGEANTVKVIKNNYTGTSYTVPATVSYNDVTFAVTEIYMGAFEKCSSLESITIPAGVTTIGKTAFSGCSSLQSVTLPEGLQKIEGGAFYKCVAVQSVTFLGNACQDAIGEMAFDGVGSIATPATLVLPNNWTGSKPVDSQKKWYGGYFKVSAPAPVARKEFVFAAGEAADSDPAMFAITWGADGSRETVKMTKKENDIYVADILPTMDSVVLVRCATGATEIIWDGEGMNVWNQTKNYPLFDTMCFGGWEEEKMIKYTF